MPDELDLELMSAIKAAQNQSAPGTGKEQLEARVGREAFRPGHTIGIGALGSEALGAAIKHFFLFDTRLGRAGGGDQKVQERHAYRNTVGGLLEVNAAAIFVD